MDWFKANSRARNSALYNSFLIPVAKSRRSARLGKAGTPRCFYLFRRWVSNLLGRDVSVPVGVVQVGWFENAHCDDGQGNYIKNVAVEVLPPSELAGHESGYADQEVEWRRFKNEIAQIENFLVAHAHQPDQALAFVDGSLVVSFAGQLEPDRQKMYVHAVEHLIEVSRQTQVPLVGYVDTSYATDLAILISYLSNYPDTLHISDAALLRRCMPSWGDRCRFYQCARKDRVIPFEGYKYYKKVAFTYLKTTSENPPARVELPYWVLEAGRQEWVLDIVRAECVVGTGYPYVIETADAVAVLSAEDRGRFMAIFQQFLIRQNIPVRFSRKAVSKRQRRL
jgi:hypothetical protein